MFKREAQTPASHLVLPLPVAGLPGHSFSVGDFCDWCHRTGKAIRAMACTGPVIPPRVR